MCHNLYQKGIREIDTQVPEASPYWISLSNIQARYLVLRYGIDRPSLTQHQLKERFKMDDSLLNSFEKSIIKKLYSVGI